MVRPRMGSFVGPPASLYLVLRRHIPPLGLALSGALLVPVPALADLALRQSRPSTTRAAVKRIARAERRSRAPGPDPRPRAVIAHLAGDPSDTISDFVFTPSTITIHVGDTVTWTNVGPTAHTATANDGSFDTGTLQKGQSGSHTFTSAGTFAYICKIHPFMHGTVVVLGSSSNGSGSSGSGSGSSASNGSGSSGSGSGSTASNGSGSSGTAAKASLPNTGSNVLATILIGGLLAAAGLVLRRRLEASRGRR